MKSGVVKRDDRLFPARLKEVKPVVEKIYWKGKEFDPSIFDKCVAMVGSRKMSKYGKRVVRKVVSEFVARDFTTVSGLMYGVDIEVHRNTYLSGGRTIGVLGYGIEYDGGAEVNSVIQKLRESGGLVISEYEDDFAPNRATFPQRNRIVVGLASKVIVVEGAKKSGSLISAELALRQGKELWAVPGPVDSKVSEGTNELIKSGKAKMLSLDELDLYSELDPINRAKHGLDRVESKIYKHLQKLGARGLGELARELEMGVGELGGKLSELEMKGVIKQDGGVYSVI